MHGQQRDRRASSDIAAIAEVCRARGVLVHTDASQAVRQAAARCRGARRRFPVADRAQVLRSEGHRRAVRARERASENRADPVRRRPRARTCVPARWPRTRSSGLGCRGHARARGRQRRRGARARPARRACGASSSPIPGVHAQRASRAARCRASSTCRFAGVEGESLITGLRGLRAVDRARPAAPPRASRATCCVRSGASTELAQSSLRLSLGPIHHGRGRRRGRHGHPRRGRAPACAGGHARAGRAGRTHGPAGRPAESQLARFLNPLARRYFLAAPRPPAFPEGELPAGCAPGAGRKAGRRDRGVSSSCKLPTGL